MWTPNGISLIPLNLLPIFQLILSIPNYIPSGAYNNRRTPDLTYKSLRSDCES
jgi:hypothetical protein